MTKLLVEDTSLVSVANAIRTKGGTTDQLVFPDGFVSAIDGIQSGGGDDLFTQMVERKITELTEDMLKGCEYIGYGAFFFCKKLTKVTIPNNIKSISHYAFKDSSISEISIPNSVTRIEGNTFQYCKELDNVIIPDSVTYIGQSSFGYCYKLTNIALPNSITTLENGMFEWCKALPNITLPPKLTKIGQSVFYYCTSLTSVTVPELVTSIRSGAFRSCSALTTVTMKPTTPPTLENKNVFQDCTALTQIIVPAGSLSAYQSASNWSAYASKMVEATE